MRDMCILGVAEAKQDPYICNNIKSETRDKCLLQYSKTKKDPKACGMMFSFKNDCYSFLGTQLNSIDLCSKITHLDTKNVCYFQIAQNTKNTSVCDSIIDSEGGNYKEYCYAETRRIINK